MATAVAHTPAGKKGSRQGTSTVFRKTIDSSGEVDRDVGTTEGVVNLVGASSGAIQLQDLNSPFPADEVATDPPITSPRQIANRPSIDSTGLGSSRRTSSSSYIKKTVESIEKSKNIKRFVTVVSILALILTFVSFWPSYGQYWYSKVTWEASVQSANQTAQLQEFQLKSQFYQSCQMNVIINNTVPSPDCEEALKYPPPSLPFPYMANAAASKLRRRIVEALGGCDCKQNIMGPQLDHDEPEIFATINPTGTPSLDGLALFFMIVMISLLWTLRKRLPIIRKLMFLIQQNLPKSWTTHHKADLEKPIGSHAQSYGTATNAAVTHLRGVAPKEQRRQTIWEAAASGNMRVVQDHLSSGMFTELDKVHPRYGTPLCAASEGGEIRIATVLLIRGANVNVQGGRFLTPIQAAAYSGVTTLVQFLLAKGADVNVRGGWSETALQAACERGDAEMVKALLDAGAPVNVGGGSLGSPLQAAASRGALDISRLLLERGVDVNEEGGEYGCALHAAVACGAMDVVDLLLEQHARVDLPPGDYGNCVQIALRHGYPVLAKSFVEKGANGDVCDEQRRTPLIEATILGDEALVTKLLEGGVDIDAQDEDRWSALHYAALEGREKLVLLFLSKGANVMLRDKFGAPALHRAAGAKSNLNIVRLLLDHGSEVDAQDVLGATALHQSAGIHEPVFRLLLERGANPSISTGMGETPLHSAVNARNLAIVKCLVEAGADLNAQDNDQATALFRSVNKGFYEISTELIECGADINIRSANAFQEALAKGQVELAKLMIDKGAAVNSQGGQHGSPLQAATCSPLNTNTLITLLLDAKANPNLNGGEFGSALGAACHFGNVVAVHLLLGKGANVNLRGGRYGSILRAAQFGKGGKEEKERIVRILEAAGAKVLVGVGIHDDDVWRLTPGGWTWLPPENKKDITSAFGSGGE